MSCDSRNIKKGVRQNSEKTYLEIFRVSGLPAAAVSSINSSAEKPTRAMPLSIPMEAGTPPLTRTTDSKCEAKAVFSG